MRLAVLALLSAAGAGAVPHAAPRQLQDVGACNGMMLEMNPIAASCCGSNMVRAETLSLRRWLRA